MSARHYNRQKLYIRRVYTHAEYDDWSEAMRKVKRKRNKRMKL
jgi:mRNA-degrading endonuclease HigB of HigAB toxin-antitoxin module